MNTRTLVPPGPIAPRGERLPVRNAPFFTASGTPPDGEKVDAQEAHPPYGVLVIDRSLTVRMIVKTCLTRAGFRVCDFPDGLQALRWLDDPQAFVPDLIVLDTDIPRMDWYTFIRILQKKPACLHTVLVMLSCRDGLVDRLKARLAGAQSYIVKPFRTQDFVSVIQHCLQHPAHEVSAAKSHTFMYNQG